MYTGIVNPLDYAMCTSDLVRQFNAILENYVSLRIIWNQELIR